MRKDNIHGSARLVDSYNKRDNFFIKLRCDGKSTILTTKCYRFYKTGGWSLLLRYYTIDITETYIQSLQDQTNKFLNKKRKIKFEYKLGDLADGIVPIYVKGKLYMVIASLNLPKNRLKSLFKPNLFGIFIDEFILDNAHGERYPKDLANKMKEIFITFKRESKKKRVKRYFFGNPYSVFNPFLTSKYLGEDLKLTDLKPGAFIVGKNFVVDCRKPKPELIQWLIENDMFDPELEDDYQRYAFGAVNINDENLFIVAKQPQNYKLIWVFKINGVCIAVYGDSSDFNKKTKYKYWACEIKPRAVSKRKRIYAIDFGDMCEGVQLLTTEQRVLFYNLKDAIARRLVAYDTISTAYFMQDLYSQI